MPVGSFDYHRGYSMAPVSILGTCDTPYSLTLGESGEMMDKSWQVKFV